MCLAIPGRIEAILTEGELARTASVSFAGVRKTVNLTFVPQAQPGDYVIVHVGVAISQVDPQQAQQIFEDLKAIGDL
ncbi:HypC/HybG/HupF family hydrogenase formation chaperone [Aestuariicella hydrocarbonica]|uniref:HypC/HybG/HupF family hydrogenase formation chaperone n=1 Tax=Pseudomaricurvus hydrocarbonicus TaxID=1470433 RepID=A0A9E5T1E8_9GAMM|nr:HypC/HybG/HupF family hydrogenase formation chaperone [Aestuariicella hydrocarbonica]NHO67305.1 HypC/HybG/HupF family hydrogenase formation chaperone [Aestuariicella hydrocarbonica]